jgi:hypothetical protein
MEKVWQCFQMIVISVFLGVWVYFMLAPKGVIEYQLYGEYSNGVPQIKVNIDNSVDDILNLSPDIKWDQAVIMVDSLNSNLKKNSIQ